LYEGLSGAHHDHGQRDHSLEGARRGRVLRPARKPHEDDPGEVASLIALLPVFQNSLPGLGRQECLRSTLARRSLLMGRASLLARVSLARMSHSPANPSPPLRHSWPPSPWVTSSADRSP